jgi:hypothetical protein
MVAFGCKADIGHCGNDARPRAEDRYGLSDDGIHEAIRPWMPICATQLLLPRQFAAVIDRTEPM